MSEIESYRIIAFEAGTAKMVFDWQSYARIHVPNPGIPSLGLEGEVLEDGEIKWRVVAIRPDSTAQVLRIDVRKEN